MTLAGREIALTGKEYEILCCLATDPGRVVSRTKILEDVWQSPWYGTSKTVDVHIAALRRKLGQAELVETVYGVGYRLAEPPDSSEAQER